ncbi:MAG: hypothetical protein ACJAS9_000614 [Polaribacter sp.]|jgi:hypothetical protein
MKMKNKLIKTCLTGIVLSVAGIGASATAQNVHAGAAITLGAGASTSTIPLDATANTDSAEAGSIAEFEMEGGSYSIATHTDCPTRTRQDVLEDHDTVNFCLDDDIAYLKLTPLEQLTIRAWNTMYQDEGDVPGEQYASVL